MKLYKMALNKIYYCGVTELFYFPKLLLQVEHFGKMAGKGA